MSSYCWILISDLTTPTNDELKNTLTLIEKDNKALAKQGKPLIPEKYRYKLFRGKTVEETKKEFVKDIIQLNYLFDSPSIKRYAGIKWGEVIVNQKYNVCNAKKVKTKYGAKWVLTIENQKNKQRNSFFLPKQDNDDDEYGKKIIP